MDGEEVSATERVSARCMFGADEEQLKATRRQYFADGLNTTEAEQLPALMQLYRDQYAQAFLQGRAMGRAL